MLLLLPHSSWPGRHNCTLLLLSNYRRQYYPQDQTSIKFATWVLKQKYKRDPHEGTSQLLPSSGFQGRGCCDSALWTQSKKTQFAFPKVAFSVATKGVFKEKKKIIEKFISYLAIFKKKNLEYCSMQWITIRKHVPASPAEQIKSFLFLLEPSACRQKHFLFISGKRLQPFDFKHRHASGLSSRKSVSPRL